MDFEGKVRGLLPAESWKTISELLWVRDEKLGDKASGIRDSFR